MSKKIRCPNCHTQVRELDYLCNGCFNCNAHSKKLADDIAFEEFYDLPKAQRWRMVWNAIKDMQ